ncbi:dipeptide ABC transporter ATP-binding protein [Brevibacterium yomogidense]|uniref:Oligopeptide transport system permease protein OppB (TC 3.A.1.5.1) n=1 Tax=Brevibacterium yomogidense TaxID=946573 RepID=A0A1X6XQ34_9MICO|nr:ABC transporter ATP-binding protein [Brevibacterium yomogidense]SLN01253.1 Oligopeptide transport system permease protein OppB (TC 3.A.1.5.1) [Brevibacterium yomogidense]
MTDPLLAVRDLTISSASQTLVHPLNFAIAPGERVGLIGESGSGKSLTSSAVMGLLPSELTAQGEVALAGESGNLLTQSEKSFARLRGSRMSMVFQEPMSALNPLMRVGDQVAEVMRLHRTASGDAASKRAIELLDQVHLPDPSAAAKAYPHQLSGGQRQRIMLAIALANSPDLLICDEPTTALDVTVQSAVLDLIDEQVTARGTGLLFITHDLAVVARVCERVMVMNAGRVVETGTVDEIFTAPQHEYTRGLLAASDLTATDSRGRLFTIATADQYAGADQQATAAEVPVTSEQTHESAPAAAPEPTTASAPEPEPATASGAADLIEMTGVVKTFTRRAGLFRSHRVEALKGIDLSVRAGGRMGIVGESGSGKSTLLSILSGLEVPTAGAVRVGDVVVDPDDQSGLTAMRRDLQIVFQDPYASLDPRMSVAEIIGEPLRSMQVGRDERLGRAEEMVEAVGLDLDALTRFPHQFSGGQRQRISIARALVTRPRILVADEPVSALDVSVRAQVLNLLADLVDDYSLTLVFVSHDLGVVRHLCSDVAVMRSGEIVEQGRTDQVYDEPAHAYTRALVAASPTIHAALSA